MILRYVQRWLVSVLSDMSEGLPALLALWAINAIVFADLVALLIYMHDRQHGLYPPYFQRDYDLIAFGDGWIIGYIVSSIGWYELGRRDKKAVIAARQPQQPPEGQDYVI